MNVDFIGELLLKQCSIDVFPLFVTPLAKLTSSALTQLSLVLSLFSGPTPAHFTELPPEFMQAIVHQFSHQPTAMAAAPSSSHPVHMISGSDSTPSAQTAASPLLPNTPVQGRVVLTRPSLSTHINQPVGNTINLRATGGQQPGQVIHRRV